MTEVQKDIEAAMREIKIKEQAGELISLRLQLRMSRDLMKHVFAEYQKLQKLQGGKRGKTR